MGPGQVMITGNSQNGLVQWLILCDWARAGVHHVVLGSAPPATPQYAGFTLIPAGWADRLRAAGAEPPRHPSRSERQLPPR